MIKMTDTFELWLEDNHNELEELFFDNLPPEDLPLDDDMTDYINNHYDDFYTFAMDYYEQHYNL